MKMQDKENNDFPKFYISGEPLIKNLELYTPDWLIKLFKKYREELCLK